MRFSAYGKEYWFTVHDPVQRRNIGSDCECLGQALEVAAKYVSRSSKTEKLLIGHCESYGGRCSYSTTFILEVFCKDNGVMIAPIKELK